MSSNNIFILIICIIITLSIWILYGSLCELRALMWGDEFTDFLQCK
ncbi:hok/gef family protein [Escherichia albertii]|uniref:Hok/gef family protein n=1 Tax=Escherichia albertii TaxID=208962 RepID=A0ABX5HBX7_ESCAL|nr:hok/gef family protein [Escherichia albertii]